MARALPAERLPLKEGATVFAVVLIASLFGILTRPYGSLAVFWPANAVLLGLFARFPRLASPAGWLGAFVGYLVADLAIGGELVRTLWLTAANLAGVVVGVVLFDRMSPDHRQLRQPSSVLHLAGVLCCAAAASGAVGAAVAHIFFGRDYAAGFAFWFTTELTNSVIVLPVMLTMPVDRPSLGQQFRWLGYVDAPLFKLAPLVTLCLALVAGSFVGGLAAFTLPSPALLWCALVYPLFSTVLLTMLVSIVLLIGAAVGLFGVPTTHIDAATMAERLGIMLLALGPLTVASVNAARMELTNALKRLATYDTLTGALTRAAFSAQAGEVLASADYPVALMTLDLDDFKTVNDTHGHAAGDTALAGFAEVVGRSLRKNDLFGRIGGEEFAILVPSVSFGDATGLAERIRAEVAEAACPLPGGGALRLTTSIGLVHVGERTDVTLDSLLAVADDALYRAKRAGRNRVVGVRWGHHGAAPATRPV